MKRIFVILILVSAGFLYGQSTIYELQQKADQLSQDYFSEKISLDEFQSRLDELSRQMQPLLRQMEQSSPSYSGAQVKRIEELMDQSKQIEMEFNNGLINENFFSVRSQLLQQELDIIIKPIEYSMTAQKQLTEINRTISGRWPGTTAGWPPAFGSDSVGELCGLGPFFQSAGTRASYSYGKHSVFGSVSIINIYQTNADAQVFQNLKNQIEKAAGRIMQFYGNESYRVEVLNPSGERVFLEIYMYRDVVCFTISNFYSTLF